MCAKFSEVIMWFIKQGLIQSTVLVDYLKEQIFFPQHKMAEKYLYFMIRVYINWNICVFLLNYTIYLNVTR